jgi:integrase
MPTNSRISAVTDYLPAEYRETSKPYIRYYVRNPFKESDKLERVVISFSTIKNKALRQKEAKRIVQNINMKLAQGWNPFFEEKAPRAFTKMIDAIEIFMNIKKRENRHETVRTYKSVTGVLIRYITEKRKLPNMYTHQFDHHEANKLMNYIYLERKVGNRMFNNYIMFYKAIFNFLKEQGYITENPFSKIKKKKKEPKKRKPLDMAARKALTEYLRKNNYPYFIIVLLAYHGLLRPNEISYLKPWMLKLDKGLIFIPEGIAKNGHDRFVSLPEYVVEAIKKLNIETIPEDYYIFSRKFLPGKEHWSRNEITRYWIELRKIIPEIKPEHQLYSLRDTGIINMIKDNIPLTEVRDQADHSSLEITNIYTKFAIPEGSWKIKNQSSEF